MRAIHNYDTEALVALRTAAKALALGGYEQALDVLEELVRTRGYEVSDDPRQELAYRILLAHDATARLRQVEADGGPHLALARVEITGRIHDLISDILITTESD